VFDLKGNILILTGTPGAGKSTTSRSLVAASSGPAVHLHADDFWHFIKKGAIPPYLSEGRKQNEVVLGVVAQAAEGYAKGDYFVVVDGIVGLWFIHFFTGLRLTVHYIVLRPALEAAMERCQFRGGETLADPEVIRGLHNQFSRLNEFENHVIETVGQTPDETLAAVQGGLVSGRFRLDVNLE
jgi:tRNA uridine 5-carbamoylmethylation protein Kti12